MFFYYQIFFWEECARKSLNSISTLCLRCFGQYNSMSSTWNILLNFPLRLWNLTLRYACFACHVASRCMRENEREGESLERPKFNLAHFFATISRHTSLILHFCHKYPVRDTGPPWWPPPGAALAELTGNVDGDVEGRFDIVWAGQLTDSDMLL